MGTLGEEVKSLLDKTLTGYVTNPSMGPQPYDAQLKQLLDNLLGTATDVDTYRDGALILLAYPVAANKVLDLTTKDACDAYRGVSQFTDRLLTKLKIPCRRDVFQTIAKGSNSWIGRDRTEWNQLLEWASKQPDVESIKMAFNYMAAGIASRTRDIPPMPELAVAQLTFASVWALFTAMLEMPSGGAHEQFIVAALLHALHMNSTRRVKTKGINASDASSGAAGDVQVDDEGGVVEAYEISANPWRTKLPQALHVMDSKQLQRVHIIASATDCTPKALQSELESLQRKGADVSVLDVRYEVRSLVCRLRRDGRDEALRKLYEHLRDRQPNDDLVRGYVAKLAAFSLVTA